jgi:hypothetical protein
LHSAIWRRNWELSCFENTCGYVHDHSTPSGIAVLRTSSALCRQPVTGTCPAGRRLGTLGPVLLAPATAAKEEGRRQKGKEKNKRHVLLQYFNSTFLRMNSFFLSQQVSLSQISAKQTGPGRAR